MRKKRGFELENAFSGRCAAHPFVAKGSARAVAPEAFESMQLLGGVAPVGSYF